MGNLMQMPTCSTLVMPNTFPVVGVTTRNAPVAHRVTECLDHLHSYASAMADNAMEEGIPVPHDLAEAWAHRLSQVADAVRAAAFVNAQVSAATAAAATTLAPSMTGKELL
jgi:hypothetical protein